MVGLVAKSWPTLCDPMDCSLPGSWGSWDFPGENTGVGYTSFFMIFPTQGSNLGLLHCKWNLYQLSHEGRPIAFFKLCIYLLIWLCLVGSGSLTRDQIQSLALETQSPSHGTTREVPALLEITLKCLSSFFF